ncbi:MAG: glycosyltransferase family 2 protein [Oscillospiraceae bacterium]|nr:glycosyltransferase family 2 protein [Oscillospiraceae bacterium]
MKLLSVAIPCYNSRAYMHNAIESCLVLGEDVEIIVVDDGSRKDNTFEIGKKYEQQYPGIVKCIHQENGGHGQAVNTGLANATGLYFKVLDSDDWFDKDCLVQVATKLKELQAQNTVVDMFIANYVYEKVSENRQNVIRYTNVLPQNIVFSWSETKHFLPHQNILMHSVIYRTQVLRDCGLKLPKHTFYVDNLFVYQPLPSVKKLYYMDADLYHYFIGREDQSVNEKVMIGRMDQQLRVNRLMIDCCDVMALEDEKLRRYMIKYLTMITAVSTVLCIKSGTEEHLARREELWQYMKNRDENLYRNVRRTAMGRRMQLKSSVGRKAIIKAYGMAQKIFSFN